MSNLCNRPIYAKGQKPAKVPALRNASRDMACKLAIPGVCRFDDAHTVGAHLRLFGIAGGAQKPDDRKSETRGGESLGTQLRDEKEIDRLEGEDSQQAHGHRGRLVSKMAGNPAGRQCLDHRV